MKPLFSKIANHSVTPVLVTLIVLLLTYAAQLYYTGHQIYGNVGWRVLPSQMFGGGVPDFIEKGTGVTNIFKKSSGWDGQFHYYVANDLFIETDVHKSIDAPIYRYQRIGLPLTAKFFSTLLGYKFVPPQIYHFVSLFFFAIALFMLIRFFQQHKMSFLYALPWALSPGVHLTMLSGLPDALADSYFIIAFLMFLQSRYGFYVFFVSLAALTRESYILPAFIIFLMNFFGYFQKDYKFNLRMAA